MRPRRFMPLLLLLLLAAPGLAASSAEPARVPAPRPRLTDELRQRSSAPPAPRPGPASRADGEKPIVMAPVEVSAPRAAASPVDEPPKTQSFTPREGGTIYRHYGSRVTTELKLQYNPKHRGWDILSFSL